MTEINNSPVIEDKSNSISEQNHNNTLSKPSETPNHFISKITSFLQSHTIYEAIPSNMKIVVFNSRLAIKRAIAGMIREDIYCCLVYNTETKTMRGVMSIMDIISLLSLINNKLKQHKDAIQSISFFIKEVFNKNKSINSLEIITEEKNEKTSSENQSFKSEVFGEANDIEEEALNKNGFVDQENKCFNQLYNAFSLITINDYINQSGETLESDINTISLDNNLYDCIKELMKKEFNHIVIEDIKSRKYCGFVSYETIFDYFIERYYSYSDMDEFGLKAIELGLVSTQVDSLNKTDTIYSCFELFLLKRISFVSIYDQDGLGLFGFVFLKDIFYFFCDSTHFSFTDSIEKFLVQLYKDLDEERPYGKERIVILDNIDIPIKQLFELMAMCPERKIVVKDKDDGIGVITLLNIFDFIMQNNCVT